MKCYFRNRKLTSIYVILRKEGSKSVSFILEGEEGIRVVILYQGQCFTLDKTGKFLFIFLILPKVMPF